MWKIHLREVNGCTQVLSSPTLPRAGEDFVEDTACPQPGPGVLVSKAAPRSPENVPKLGAGSAASCLGSGCTRPLSVSRRTGTWAKARPQPLVPGSRLGSVHAGYTAPRHSIDLPGLGFLSVNPGSALLPKPGLSP